MELSSFQNNLFSLLFLAVVVHSIYLSVLIFAKSHKEHGLNWLGFLMIPVSLLLLAYLLYVGNLMRSAPHLLGIFVPVFYTIGPLYYFFVRYSSNEKDHFRWYDLLHLIPLLYVTWEWLPVYTMSLNEKLSIIDRTYSHTRPSLTTLLYSNRLFFLILVYLIVSYKWLNSRLHQSDSSSTRTKWLINFTLAFGVVLILFISIQVIFWAFHWKASIMELILVLILALTVHVLGYVILGKDKVLPQLIRPEKVNKYVTSPLTFSQIAEIKDKIISYLESERPWLNQEFSIKNLTAALNIPGHHISQVLNEGLKKNFYDLICQYRVEEVKQRLQTGDRSKYSIWGIAANCGFASKSSFNRAFKKITGLTPSDYLKSNGIKGLTTE